MSAGETTVDPIVAAMRREWVRGMVQRAIFCPRTERVLDVRTCVVLVDRDGDPHSVVSPEGWQDLVDKGLDEKLRTLGITVDPTTVRT